MSIEKVPPILEVIYAIEQYCDLTDKTDEYRDHLVSVVKDLETKSIKFDELEKYTRKTRERWVEVLKKNIELEKKLENNQ